MASSDRAARSRLDRALAGSQRRLAVLSATAIAAGGVAGSALVSPLLGYGTWPVDDVLGIASEDGSLPLGGGNAPVRGGGAPEQDEPRRALRPGPTAVPVPGLPGVAVLLRPLLDERGGPARRLGVGLLGGGRREEARKITPAPAPAAPNDPRAVSADTDGDGMPDAWEQTVGLNPLADDSNADSDGDGLDNLTEYYVARNPRATDSNGDGRGDGDDDADGDGVSNAIEIASALTPWSADSDGNGVDDGREDSDGDRLSNATEAAMHSDIRNQDTDGDGVSDGDSDPDLDGLASVVEQTLGLLAAGRRLGRRRNPRRRRRRGRRRRVQRGRDDGRVGPELAPSRCRPHQAMSPHKLRRGTATPGRARNRCAPDDPPSGGEQGEGSPAAGGSEPVGTRAVAGTRARPHRTTVGPRMAVAMQAPTAA